MAHAFLEAGIADVVGAAALGMRQRCGDYQRPRRKQHGEGEGCVDTLECHFTYFYFAFSILSTTSAVSIMGEFKIIGTGRFGGSLRKANHHAFFEIVACRRVGFKAADIFFADFSTSDAKPR